MKNSTHNPARFRSAFAAVFAGLALALVPAAGRAAVSFTEATKTMTSIADPTRATLRVDAGENGADAQIQLTVDNPRIVNLFNIDPTTGLPFGNGSSTITVDALKRLTEIYVGPAGTPGTATLTATLFAQNGGESTATMTVVVTAPNTITFRDVAGQATTSFVFAETDRYQGASFFLDFGYDFSEAVTFNVTSTDDGTHLADVPATITVNQGQGSYANGHPVLFSFTPADGELPRRTYSLTFAGTDGVTFPDGVPVSVTVTNIPPVIGGTVPDYNYATSWGVAKQAIRFTVSSVNEASGVDRDAGLTYTWVFDDGTGTVDTGAENTVTHVFSDGDGTTLHTVRAIVRDKDGGESTVVIRGTINPGVLVKFDSAGPDEDVLPGATKVESFSFTRPEGTVWDPDGNNFRPGADISVSPVLRPGTYPFGWIGSEDMITIPNMDKGYNSVTTLLLQAPQNDDATQSAGPETIYYMASLPWMKNGYLADDGTGTIAPYYFDQFGDIDQDGLADIWETYWFGRVTMTEIVDNGFASGAAVYDEGGNGEVELGGQERADFLPTLPTDVATNKIAGGFVHVFPYPLVCNAGDNSYATVPYPDDFDPGSVFDDTFTFHVSRRTHNTPFNNLLEFRGLDELRLGADGETLKDANGAEVWAYYTDRSVADRTYTNRGNAPGTSPLSADTDGDGFDDGWEYYFWTTLMYEVHTEKMRAYDPTFTLYAPYNGAYSANANPGLPLMKEGVGDFIDTVAVAEPQDPWDVFEYNGSVTNAPLVNTNLSVHVDFPNGFQLFNLIGGMDARGNAILYCTDGFDVYATDARINLLTGQYYIPGVANMVLQIPDVLREFYDWSEEAPIPTITTTHQDGLFSREYLMSLFDPNNAISRTVNPGSIDYPWFTGQIVSNNLGSTVLSTSSIEVTTRGWVPALDIDGDGLTNEEEYYLGTNPLHWDTDEDGMPDGWEVMMGLLPLDARNLVDGNLCGPNDNPDQDFMATGPYGTTHWLVQKYRWDHSASGGGNGANFRHEYEGSTPFLWANYWNGAADGCFDPGAALVGSGSWTVRADADPLTLAAPGYCNRDEFLFARYMIAMGAASVVYPGAWDSATTNPLDNDSNQNGLPDGWEAYVGCHPKLKSVLVGSDGSEDDPVSAFTFLPVYTYRYGVLPPQFDDNDGLSLWDEFDCEVAAGVREADETIVVGSGATCYRRAFPRRHPEWTNKILPTDPSCDDTDGDGLADNMEYQEDYDFNGDGSTLANFNPTSADTDGDWLPDAWEYTMGNYSTNQTNDAVFGTFGDPDGDGLANFQEYLTGAQYGWRYDWWYSPANTNYWRSLDGSGEDDTVGFVYYRPGDFFRPQPDWAEMYAASNLLLRLEARYGLSGEGSPVWGKWSNVGVQKRVNEVIAANPLNIVMIAWQGRQSVTKEDDPYGYISVAEADLIMDLSMNIGNFGHYHIKGGHTMSFNHGLMPFAWDGAGNSGTGDPTSQWTFMPNNYVSGEAGFPGTSPRMMDTDADGMSDYWELYHGLNPTYGGCRLSTMVADGLNERMQGANATNVDGDRADGGPTVQGFYVGADGYVGDGSTDNWRMGWDPTYVRNMHETAVGLRPVSLIETTSFTHLICPPQMEWGHFDPVRRPWLSGDRVADPDQDGLANEEEAAGYLANDILHHTDPSPYWITDTSDPMSYVNLYYRSSGLAPYWWWDFPLINVSGDPPTYLFDFEVNEGYDTDNNNVCDRGEMTATDGHFATDPLDFDSPVSRKAMYFDGNAACRTRQPFFHDKYSLASYTVEFWFRPQEPVSSRTQTLIHRPVLMPVNEGSGAYAWTTRNTFCIELDPEGHIVARVDNDAIEQAAQQTVSVRGGRVVPDIWNHVAVSMDSVGNTLTIYLNGELVKQASTSLKPCTGILLGLDHLDYATQSGTGNYVYDLLHYDYSPAPIVVGAYDTNGWGVVSGYNLAAGNRDEFQQPMFDGNKFYKGWIDEIRVWDRCRSSSEIKNDMKKRYTASYIEPINQERFRWDNVNREGATSLSDFPQKLLYHYSFDSLPDVARAPADRDDTFLYGKDTDKVPEGWDLVAQGTGRSDGFLLPSPPRAVNASMIEQRHAMVPWWYTANARSTIYGPDYGYVPYIQNTVAHLSQRPPQDMRQLIPLYNTSYALYGYRFRANEDWMQETMLFLYPELKSAYPIQPNPVSEDYPAVWPEQLRNSMNPYGETYHTSVSSGYERNTTNFGGHLDRWGIYEYVPILSDMLPLLDAVADIDVPMWDDDRPGWDMSAIDSDGDGLPDWWEISHGLDPNDATGINGAYGDADGDGLDNYAEYLSGTDPHAGDTDGDGYTDYYSRPDRISLTYGELYDDGDGMDNAWEISHGLNPDRFDADTDPDNDGWTNWEEFMAQTDPSDSGDFPHPKFNVTFHYDGEQAEMTGLGVYTYGEKTSGDTMGGSFDGRYTMAVNHSDQIYLGVDGVVTLGEHSDIGLQGQFGTTKLEHGLVEAASINIRVPTAEGYEYREFQMTVANEALGVFTTDNDGWLFMDLGSGRLYMNGVYYGCLATVSYTVKSYAFPESFSNLIRNPFGAHTHMVGGPNRFFGWMDVNGNQEFDFGEPMGISLYNPTVAGWDSVQTEIMLSDGLWDFPRLSWPASAGTNIVNTTEYLVTLRWVGSSTETDETDTTTTTVGGGAYGDVDGDGLDAFQESRAGTETDKMDSAGDGRMDYDSQSAAGRLTWGELYDDGDMMPAQWEMANGLDPDRYDADGDLDDDGWSNYAEYIAGSDPKDPESFPEPIFDVTFLYAGDMPSSFSPKVLAYSEKKQGTYLDGNASRGIYMGGNPDGVYTSMSKAVGMFGNGVGSQAEAMGAMFYVSDFGGRNIGTATLSYYQGGQQVGLALQPYDADYGYFVNDETAHIFLEYRTGRLLSLFEGDDAEQDRWYSIEYSVASSVFPVEVPNMTRVLEGNHNHMVEGYNRYFGFLDLDNDDKWSAGEPAGLSLYNSVYAGPDSVKTTIPLTDELCGFPRLSWPASSNDNVTAYTVYVWNGAGTLVVPDEGIRVEAPRTFVHEGDYLEAGIRGIDFGNATVDRFSWSAVANNGLAEEIVAEGEFVSSLVPNTGSRRTMKAVSPVAGSTVYGSLVEFQWEMDWRTEGVFFTVKDSAGKVVKGLDNLYVPLPVRHNRTTDDDYYFTYVPQLENGRSIVDLPSGTYTYTIKENVRSTAVTAQSVSGTFKIDNADTSRVRAAINGHVHYYGRLGTALVPGKVVVQAYSVPDQSNTSLAVGGSPVSRTTVAADGSFSLRGLKAGSYAVIGWVDADGDGEFASSDTQGFGFLGGSACPIQVPSWCPPLVITNNTRQVAIDLDDVHVVLRDRDVDGDGKPESWTGTAATWMSAALRTFPATVPAGADWVNAYLFSTTRVARVITTTTSSRSRLLEYVTKRYVVKAPRQFFHEWDMMRVGDYGLNLGVTNTISVDWSVAASDGFNSEKITEGNFVVSAGNPDDRRPMRAVYPTQLTKVRGSVVEFEWEMDWRNAGVRFQLENITDADAPVTVFDGVIPMPVLHGKTTTLNYYYTCKPQLQDGLRFLELPDGVYRYTIIERPRTSLFTAQSVTGTFQKVTEDESRSVHAIGGRIEYYGKVLEPTTVAAGIASGDGTSRVLTALVDTNLVHRGSMAVYVMQNGTPVDSLNDSKGNGVLFAENSPNAYSGSIVYRSDEDPSKAEINVTFLVAPGADVTLDLVEKRFPVPLVLQAFKVPENAESALSFSGTPVAQVVQEQKGSYRIDGLGQGAYAVRGWLDSNGNRIPDNWETIGYATYASTVSPNLDRFAAPIRVTNDVLNTVIVLHDRDTDNDLLPDAWESWKFGDLETSGYEQTQPGLYIWQEYADGLLDSDPRTPDTDLDGLTDAMEILVTGTDTHLADTDGDGVGDLEEFLAGSDPLDPADTARYSTPALAFDADGVPYVDIDYPALKPGVVLTYELQRKLSLSDETWETVAEASFGNTNGVMSYGTVLGANDDRSPAGTARMRPADQAEGVDFAAGFYRVKIYADYGKMVDNGDGTWSYWTWVRDTVNVWTWSEAARGEGTLVRDGEGNWRFVADPDDAKSSGSLVRGADGSWNFVQ